MNTVSLNYKQIGEGKNIVILHGLFGSLDNWQTMAKELAENDYCVTTVDLRNHGKSPHTNEMSHELMANDVAQLIQELELNNCCLVGHSMGGKTAMQLAISQPNLLEKLVVVDIAPKPYLAHHNTYFKAMMNLDVEEIQSRSQADELLSKSIKNNAIKQFLLKNLDRTKTGYQWKFNLDALYNHYDKLIDGLTTTKQFLKPTLFIAGQLSDYISKSDLSAINTLFPNSELTFIEEAGHWVHAEQPNTFKNTLLSFLKK